MKNLQVISNPNIISDLPMFLIPKLSGLFLSAVIFPRIDGNVFATVPLQILSFVQKGT